jgi:hypothetical protein
VEALDWTDASRDEMDRPGIWQTLMAPRTVVAADVVCRWVIIRAPSSFRGQARGQPEHSLHLAHLTTPTPLTLLRYTTPTSSLLSLRRSGSSSAPSGDMTMGATNIDRAKRSSPRRYATPRLSGSSKTPAVRPSRPFNTNHEVMDPRENPARPAIAENCAEKEDLLVETLDLKPMDNDDPTFWDSGLDRSASVRIMRITPRAPAA